MNNRLKWIPEGAIDGLKYCCTTHIERAGTAYIYAETGYEFCPYSHTGVRRHECLAL